VVRREGVLLCAAVLYWGPSLRTRLYSTPPSLALLLIPQEEESPFRSNPGPPNPTTEWAPGNKSPFYFKWAIAKGPELTEPWGQGPTEPSQPRTWQWSHADLLLTRRQPGGHLERAPCPLHQRHR
jgi:hypothetical protein